MSTVNIHTINFRAGTRKTIDIEDSQNLYGKFFPDVIEPILDPYSDVISIVENNEVLPQCISARVVGTLGYGFTLQEKTMEEDFREANETLINEEKDKFDSFLNNCNEFDENIQLIMTKVQRDLKTFGYAAIEVVRNGNSNLAEHDIKSIYHVPLIDFRVGKLTKEYISFEDTKIIDFEIVRDIRRKKFRFFIITATQFTREPIYFKEFNDPRVIDCRTGEEKEGILPDNWATEIIFFEQQNPQDHIYPKPEWYGALASVLGMRKAQLANLNYLDYGHLENSLLMVSGRLSTESLDNIKRELLMNRGINSLGKMIVVEVDSIEGNAPIPKIEKLTDNLLKDGAFMAFKEECRNDILSAMRVPAILAAQSKDYNKATSQQAMEMFEKNVCSADRYYLEWKLKTTLFDAMGMRFHEFKFNSPNLTDWLSVAKMVELFNKIGAMTPNEGRKVWNLAMNRDMELIEEEWGNMPFKPQSSPASFGGETENTIEDVTDEENTTEDVTDEENTTEDVTDEKDIVKNAIYTDNILSGDLLLSIF